MAINAEGRHSATQHLIQFFESAHLREDLKPIAEACIALAEQMLKLLPDSPELTAGLRLLLQAKDSFVRAGLTK